MSQLGAWISLVCYLRKVAPAGEDATMVSYSPVSPPARNRRSLVLMNRYAGVSGAYAGER